MQAPQALAATAATSSAALREQTRRPVDGGRTVGSSALGGGTLGGGASGDGQQRRVAASGEGLDRYVQHFLRRDALSKALERHRNGSGHEINSSKTPPIESGVQLTLTSGQPMVGTVKVSVVAARGLTAKDAAWPGSAATSDPYVECFVGDLYWRTRVVPKQLDPQWNEECSFEVASSSEVLHLVVWDFNQFNKVSRRGNPL